MTVRAVDSKAKELTSTYKTNPHRERERCVSGVICYVVTASQTVSDLLRDKPKGKHLNLVSQFPRYWLAGWLDAAISTGRVYSSSIHTRPSKLLEHDTPVCVHIPLYRCLLAPWYMYVTTIGTDSPIVSHAWKRKYRPRLNRHPISGFERKPLPFLELHSK